MEARYDAMPPDVSRALSLKSADPLALRHHRLRREITFARRMFRANHRAWKNKGNRRTEAAQPYRNDCRYWWRRYRKARASAADIRALLALRDLGVKTFI